MCFYRLKQEKATHKTDIKWMATNICSRQSESVQVWSVFRTKAPFLSILIGCITVSRAVLFRAVYDFAKDATADISPIALCANLRASNVVSWFEGKENRDQKSGRILEEIGPKRKQCIKMCRILRQVHNFRRTRTF